MKNKQKNQRKLGINAGTLKSNIANRQYLTQNEGKNPTNNLDLHGLSAEKRNLVDLAMSGKSDLVDFPERKELLGKSKPGTDQKISKSVLKTIKRHVGMYGGPGALLCKHKFELIVRGIYDYHPALTESVSKKVICYLQKLKSAQRDDRKRRDSKITFPL